jgi:hypothetical protein
MISMPSETAAEDHVLHDVRTMHDLAGLPLTLDRDPPAEWLVVRVIPALDSGAAERFGTAVDIRTGQVVDTGTGEPVGPGTVPLVVVKRGHWELILAVAGSSAPNDGAYLWSEPLARTRILRPEDLYSPFVKGGVALCRYDSRADGPQRFDPLYLIPAEVSADIVPAYETVRRQPEVFRTESSDAPSGALLDLLTSSNVLLRVFAIRQMFHTGRHADVRLRTALLEASGLRKGIGIYLAATSPQSANENAVQALLTAAVDQASSVDDVKAVAVALLAVNFLRPAALAARPWLPTLMLALRNRVSTPDPYLAHAVALLSAA